MSISSSDAGPSSSVNNEINPQLSLHTLPTTLEQALQPSNEARVITEPSEPFRIVHVSDVWCQVCGFDAEEALGQTCRILQGLGTCQATLGMLRQALMLQRNFAVRLLNYTKRGRPFMSTLQVAPLYNTEGAVTHYLGVIIARFLNGGNIVPPSVQLHSHPAPVPATKSGSAVSSLLAFDSFMRDSLGGELGMRPLSPTDDFGIGGKDPETLAGGLARVPPFLTKLSEILSSESREIVNMSPEKATFCIVDPSRFAKEVLPKYFKHNKLGSFSQQLHTYGFRRKSASSQSMHHVIEFCHERYGGEPAQFLNWIRTGGALSKRQAVLRDATTSSPPQLPSKLMQDLIGVNDGMQQLAFLFNRVKATHIVQLRTILVKLMMRKILTPETASYICSLPPATPIDQPLSGGVSIDESAAGSINAEMTAASASLNLTAGGLQAQLEALEAGLAPFENAQSRPGQSSEHGSGSTESLAVDVALQFFADTNAAGSQSRGN